jgi:hypothetical protein
MSNIFSLLPVALDAGTPQEAERIVVRKPRIEPAPLPEAWLQPSSDPPSRTRSVLPFYGLLLAVILGLVAWDYFTPPTTTSYVTPTTHDSACPAP